MTTRFITGVLAAAALAAAVPGTFAQEVKGKPAGKTVAADKAAMSIPKPAAEMAELKPFDGSWSCEGAMLPSPFGPGGKMTSSVKTRRELGGFWQSGTVKGTTAGMPPFEGMFHTTYDPSAKQYVMLWVDNMGSWSQSTSKGWEGDKIVYSGEGVMGGQKMMGRDTFTKGEGTLKHSWEMQVAGKWTPMGDETCKKSAAAPAKQ